MNRLRLVVDAAAAIAAIGTGTPVLSSLASAAAETTTTLPSTAAGRTTEAAKFDQEAKEFNKKAERHIQLAAWYKA